MAMIHCNFFSEALGLSTAMDVILPEVTVGQIGMESVASDREPPVLYLLHGLSDDHTIWQRRTSIERYVAPLGLAVVMPNVHRSFYTDMQHGGRYGTFMSEELPAKVQRLFRVSGRREDTFVAGLSMGGYGAFKLALQHPDRYAAAASLSGALDLASCRPEPDDYRSSDWRHIFGDRAIDGTEHDLLWCAAELASSGVASPKLFQCCGTEDFLYEENGNFLNRAQELNLPLTYEEGPGAHSWDFWDTWIQRVLVWLPIQP